MHCFSGVMFPEKQLLPSKQVPDTIVFLTMIQQLQPKREDLKPGQVLCEFCTAKCCHYFALPIEKPICFEDFEYLRWYLLHERASLFTEDGIWFLLVHTVCKHLQSDYRCGIYESRPLICQSYTTDECEYDDGWTYEQYFETPEQIAEFTDALFTEPGDENFRSPHPPLLPILG